MKNKEDKDTEEKGIREGRPEIKFQGRKFMVTEDKGL